MGKGNKSKDSMGKGDSGKANKGMGKNVGMEWSMIIVRVVVLWVRVRAIGARMHPKGKCKW